MSTGAMTEGWYYSKRGMPEGHPAGPLTWEELHARAQAGDFGPQDLVWNSELPEWLPAVRMPGLIPTLTSPVVARTQQAPPSTASPGRGRSLLLPILMPALALIVVGAGLGVYFGLFWHRDDSVATTATSAAVSTTAAVGETSTEGDGNDLEEASSKLPELSSIVDSATWGEVPANQVCVLLAEDRSRDDAEDLAKTLGGTVVGEIAMVNAYQIETSGSTEADLQAAINTARAAPGVLLATPNQPISSTAAGEIWGKRISPLDDPAYNGAQGQGYALTGVQTAWDYIRGSGLDLNPVKVGVLDTGMYAGNGQFDGGVNIEYTEEAAKRTSPETIKYSDGSTGDDPAGGHGTSINTIIGADADDGGPAGIASILGNLLTICNTNHFTAPYGYDKRTTTSDPNDPSKFDWEDGNTYQFDEMEAIMAQVRKGSTVINLSWGPSDYSKVDAQTAGLYKQFFERLNKMKPEIVFVAAAGNNGKSMDGEHYYPAGFSIPNLITVGNLNNDGSMFKESNTKSGNFEVTVSAPGEQSVRGYDSSTGKITATDGGSSMAAPQVAATAALLKSIYPYLTAAQIKDIIRVTARKNDAGDPILAVDEAIFEVINMTRELNGDEPLTRDQMRNQGVIDAVATPVENEENQYVVRAIVGALNADEGADVNIVVSPGEILDGDDPRHMTSPGEVGWIVRMHEDEGSITVYRRDSGAGSRISLEKLDLNGHWKGSFTFTHIEGADEAAAAAGSGSSDPEGCDLSVIVDVLAKIPGRAFPLTIDITVDEHGKGTAVMLIDFSSLVAEIAAAYPEANVEAVKDPWTMPFTLSGNTLIFGDGGAQSATDSGRMEGTVTKQGDTLYLKGILEGTSGEIGIEAVWDAIKEY
jgi:hypothetical protein